MELFLICCITKGKPQLHSRNIARMIYICRCTQLMCIITAETVGEIQCCIVWQGPSKWLGNDIKRSSLVLIWKSFAHLSSCYFHAQSYLSIHDEWGSKWFCTAPFRTYSNYLGTQISIAIAASAKCCIYCGSTQIHSSLSAHHYMALSWTCLHDDFLCCLFIRA